MGPSMNFWLAIVAAATAAKDVATTAALRVRAYEDGDLRGPEEWCESNRRLLLSAALVFFLNMFLGEESQKRPGSATRSDYRGPTSEVG